MISVEFSGMIELLGVFKLIRKTAAFNTNKRNFSVLSYRHGGEADFVQHDRSINIRRGDIVYIPANIEYSQSTHGEALIAVHLNLPDYITCNIEKLTPLNTTIFDELFNELYREWEEKNTGFKYKCMSILYKILYLIQVQHTGSESPDKLGPALEHMNKHFTDSALSIGYLADLAGISEVYFRKLFRRKFGKTPIHYLNDLRMDYARNLLQSGYYTVYEVAQKSGFNDVKYFSTRFKHVTGKTPSEIK